MRFSRRITLVTEQDSRYDPKTGRVIKPEPEKTVIPAKITPLKAERKAELFGNINANITMAITRFPIKKEFDYVLIGDKKYNVKARSDYRKGVLYLEGVNIES